jgi:DNA-binding protein HU-beta
MAVTNILNKHTLSKLIAAETGFSEEKSYNAITAVSSSITEALKEGDVVTLIGFGTFSVTDSAAKEGRNPKTKEVITIPASKKPKFKAGKQLKEAVN